MTKILDAAAAIRKVSALRALCLSLPHVPTPAELSRLRRFDELVASPESATALDVEPLVAGWRRWWSQGETERLRAMAARLPAGLVDGDRRLAGYACAAAARAGTPDRSREARNALPHPALPPVGARDHKSARPSPPVGERDEGE